MRLATSRSAREKMPAVVRADKSNARAQHTLNTEDELQLAPVPSPGIAATRLGHIGEAIAKGCRATCGVEARQQSCGLGEDLVGVDLRRKIRRTGERRLGEIGIELAQIIDREA